MTYINYNVTVSDGQKKKIRSSYADGEGVSIRLSYKDLLDGEDVIALTKTQYSRVLKAKENGKGLEIKMSPAQVKANLKIEGGFLSALLGLATRFLPTIAKAVLPGLAVGALSGAASAGVERAIKGNGLYLKKGGRAYTVEPVANGSGLFLHQTAAPTSISGNGLYLKRGSSYRAIGKGLILGPNSPFKNIPILGAIL